MKDPMYQAWPDRTLVRFTPEARRKLLAGGIVGLPPESVAEALLPGKAFTAVHVDEPLHDVVLEELGSRWGTYWLEPVDEAAAQHWRDEVRPRKGEWLETVSGKRFWLQDPRPSDVDPFDIAHSLSMQCRYNGHVARFYSVAQHSALVSDVVLAMTDDPGTALWALLHDAGEAYVGDMVRPLKRTMPQFQAAEDEILRAVMKAHSLPPEQPALVSEIDTRILLNERDAFMNRSSNDWGIEGQPLDISPELLTSWPQAEARAKWLERYYRLVEMRKKRASAGGEEALDGQH